MKRSALHVYALVVCCLLIIPLLIFGSVAVYSIFEMAWPELTLSSHVYKRYQSDAAYRGSLAGRRLRAPTSNAEIAQRRRTGFQEALDLERRGGMQRMIRAVIFGLISLGLFLLHWRLMRRNIPPDDRVL